jgi:hypothetical protein
MVHYFVPCLWSSLPLGYFAGGLFTCYIMMHRMAGCATLHTLFTHSQCTVLKLDYLLN